MRVWRRPKGSRFRVNVGRQYLLIYFLLNPVNLFQFLCPLVKLRIYYAVCIPGHRGIQQR